MARVVLVSAVFCDLTALYEAKKSECVSNFVAAGCVTRRPGQSSTVTQAASPHGVRWRGNDARLAVGAADGPIARPRRLEGVGRLPRI